MTEQTRGTLCSPEREVSTELSIVRETHRIDQSDLILVCSDVPARVAELVGSLEENNVFRLVLVLPGAAVHVEHSVVRGKILILQLNFGAAGHGGGGPLPSEGTRGGVLLFDPLEEHTVGVGADWSCRCGPRAEFIYNSPRLRAQSDL